MIERKINVRNFDEIELFGIWLLLSGKNKDVINDFIIERNRSWFVRKDNEISFSILSLRYFWDIEVICLNSSK